MVSVNYKCGAVSSRQREADDKISKPVAIEITGIGDLFPKNTVGNSASQSDPLRKVSNVDTASEGPISIYQVSYSIYFLLRSISLTGLSVSTDYGTPKIIGFRRSSSSLVFISSFSTRANNASAFLLYISTSLEIGE